MATIAELRARLDTSQAKAIQLQEKEKLANAQREQEIQKLQGCGWDGAEDLDAFLERLRVQAAADLAAAEAAVNQQEERVKRIEQAESQTGVEVLGNG